MELDHCGSDAAGRQSDTAGAGVCLDTDVKDGALQELLPDNDRIPPSPVPLENHDKRLENPKWTYIITLISAAPCTWA